MFDDELSDAEKFAQANQGRRPDQEATSADIAAVCFVCIALVVAVVALLNCAGTR